jgi:hypothetical protein
VPRKKLSRNAPCPCGSGKTYKHCCYNKDFEYLVDDEGDIFKSIPVSDGLAEVIDEQKRRFVEKYSREPGPGDNLFFDMPPLEHAEHFMVEAMKQAGLDPAIIYAFEKTGLLVTEANQHLISDVDRAKWEAAVLEYRAKQGDDDSKEDDEDGWF